MRTITAIMAVIIIGLCMCIAVLNDKNMQLKENLYQAGCDIEATDDYYSSLLGDYQIDVYMDTVWLRDGDKLVSTWVLGKYDEDPLATAIMDDNQ